MTTISAVTSAATTTKIVPVDRGLSAAKSAARTSIEGGGGPTSGPSIADARIASSHGARPAASFVAAHPIEHSTTS